MSLVARAEIVARLAHAGQIDKSGVEYTEHLRAVSEKAADLAGWEWSASARIVGWLHDIVEDTPVELHELVELGFRDHLLDAVRLLTHTHEHEHADYIRAIRDAETPGGHLARIVKRADLWHNSLPERSRYRNPESLRRRYERAIAILEGREP